MSLILEALKKSEAQRQLGAAPTLATPFSTARRRRSPLPWLLLVFALIAAGGAAWWWLQRARPGAPRVVSAMQADTGSHREPPMRIDPAPANPAASPAAVLRPRPPLIPPAINAPAANPPVASAPTPKSPIAPPPVAAPAVANATPPAAAAIPAPAPAAPPPVTPSEPALPSVYDLPIALRRDMPQMTMSMQVYSADPARRFIVVDGERKKEGDTIHDVAVREIRANGVVLEYRGQRFVFPRPGS